jgi:broad-specificity NMP kinase
MIDKCSDIVIIKGSPGAGKSQTAKALSRSFPHGVRLEVDTIRQMVISVNWTDQVEHIKLLEMAAKLSCEFLEQGFKPIIVVDTFSGDKIHKFLFHFLSKSYSYEVYSLYTSEHELKKRLEARTEGQFKDFEISKRQNLETILRKQPNEEIIDTTALTADQTANEISKIMSRNFHNLVTKSL